MLTKINNGCLEAFANASGIQPSEFSYLIRIALLSGFLIWSAWCVLELLKYYKSHNTESISNLIKDYIRVFFLVSIVITLVFVA